MFTKYFNNLKFKSKMLGGFGTVILLLIVVTTVAFYTLFAATNGFIEYRMTAITTNTIGRVQANLLSARLQVKGFFQTGDTKLVAEFEDRISKMKKFTNDAINTVSSEEHKNLLEDVNNKILNYQQGFEEVVSYMEERNKIVNETLNVVGVQIINNQLTPLMNNGNVNAARAIKHMLFVRLYAIKFLEDNKQENVDRVIKEFGILKRYLQALPRYITSNVNKYRTGFEKVVQIIKDRNDIIQNVLDKRGPEIANDVERLKLDIKENQDVLGPALQASNSVGINIVVTIGVLATILGLVFAFLISGSVTKPILLASNMMQELGKGKLRNRLNLDSNDEIGAMAKAMDFFADKLSEFTDVMHRVSAGDFSFHAELLDEADEISPALNKITVTLNDLNKEIGSITEHAQNGDLGKRGEAGKFEGGYEKIISGLNETLEAITEPIKESRDVLETMATGDLTARVDGQYKGDHAVMKDAVNKVGDSIGALIVNVTEAVQATASAANEISASTEQMAAGAQEQSSQTQEVATAMEQMTKTIVETAQNSGIAAKTSDEGGEFARTGVNKVKETIAGMNNIASSTERTGEVVFSLANKSNQIGEIAQVIDDIADQTNLLALNAAIEAARAGEQGRGFAVVADEVRKLAERTTKATKEIGETIKGIQSESEEANKAMQESSAIVEKGMELTKEIAEQLEQIEKGAAQTNEVISQVAVAAEEQSSTAEEISGSIETINNVTNESASSIHEVAATAEDLNRLTEKLSQMIVQFKVNSNERGNYLIS